MARIPTLLFPKLPSNGNLEAPDLECADNGGALDFLALQISFSAAVTVCLDKR